MNCCCNSGASSRRDQVHIYEATDNTSRYNLLLACKQNNEHMDMHEWCACVTFSNYNLNVSCCFFQTWNHTIWQYFSPGYYATAVNLWTVNNVDDLSIIFLIDIAHVALWIHETLTIHRQWTTYKWNNFSINISIHIMFHT